MKFEVKHGSYTIDDKVIDFEYYTNVPMIKKINFVNDVCNTLIIDENYYSLLRDLIFNFMIVDTFTDIDLVDIKEAFNSLDVIEDFVNSGIAEIVKSNLEAGVLDELNKAIDDNIEYKTGIHKDEITNAIASLVNTLEDKLQSIDVENTMQLAENLNLKSNNLTAEHIIEAYGKTNMFNKTIDEIKQERDKINNSMTDLD